jgi:hypothetical protein
VDQVMKEGQRAACDARSGIAAPTGLALVDRTLHAPTPVDELAPTRAVHTGKKAHTTAAFDLTESFMRGHRAVSAVMAEHSECLAGREALARRKGTTSLISKNYRQAFLFKRFSGTAVRGTTCPFSTVRHCDRGPDAPTHDDSPLLPHVGSQIDML